MIAENIINLVKPISKLVKDIKGNREIKINGFSSLNSLTSGKLTFIKRFNDDNLNKLSALQIGVICPYDTFPEQVNTSNCAFILVDNPRLAFIKLLNFYQIEAEKRSVHESAFIHPEAQIGKNVLIAPNCYIGKSKIGAGCTIRANVVIYDNVVIGENVTINANTVVGSEGFGFEKDEETGEYIKFPHIGGVIIGDNVSIGSNTSIDRAALDNTIISKGVKIDNLVHIAHNVSIGENSVVISNSMIAGSVSIGSNVWIAPSASILNGITIGDDCFIGMGAVVIRDIASGLTVAGSPARPMSDFKKLMKHEAKVINE